MCAPGNVAGRCAPWHAVRLITIALFLAGCGSVSPGSVGAGAVRVVAAENFWASIAGQIGGSHAGVQSIIVNPAQDPHAYEPTAADARAMATAQLAIVNGIGYDRWAPRLLAANPVAGRAVLSVGSLFGLTAGNNPHRWYDPNEVELVARAIATDLERLDPRGASYYAQRLSRFQSVALGGYHAAIAELKRRYSGVPVGASESIFALLAPALGLRLITPPSFMKAVTEGTEVTPQDTVTVERQISHRAIKVWVYNSQNVTPEIARLDGLARSLGIPIATVTETLSPARASFQQWQVSQLRAIAAALRQATGR